MYTLPVRRLKDILKHVIPNATLGSLSQLETTQLARLYKLHMSDDQELLLSYAPRLTVRLLRHEATIMSSEATLVQFIAAAGRREEIKSSPKNDDEPQPGLSVVTEMIPRLLKHSSSNKEMAYPYSIFEPTLGAPLSTLSIYLSLPVRQSIDAKIGTMARSLANLTSPSKTFGMVSRVLPDPFPTSPSGASTRTNGSKTWSEAFNALLEMILRDGEDMSVLLPYDEIRAHFQRLKWRLNAITIPRLALLNIGSETNVMIERGPEETGSPVAERSVKVTGLRSWSQGVFGDPLIASCFDEPSEGFLKGWRAAGEDIIEDTKNSDGRVLLYRCYRAVVMIVTEYYRPQSDSSKRELDGRRKLTSALADLQKVDVVVEDMQKRTRSVSVDDDAEDSKRQKVRTA